MLDAAVWLRTLAAGEPLRRHALTVVPLLAGGFGDPDVADLDGRSLEGLVHLAAAPAGPGFACVLVANRNDRPLLLLQGQELWTDDGPGFEVLAPRLTPPGGMAVLYAAASREPDRRGRWFEGGGDQAAVDLLDLVRPPPPPGTTGYLALVAGRFARLELFPNAAFCLARWAWALESVVGLAASFGATPGAPPGGPDLGSLRSRLAEAVAGGWRHEAEGVFRLDGPGDARVRGHAVLSGGRLAYLDLAARLRPARGVAATATTAPRVPPATATAAAVALGEVA